MAGGLFEDLPVIETEQSVVIDVPIDGIWNYVRDIRRWANMMPGLQDCDIIDDNDSHWTLKVGVGGLVRTVRVLVHVDQWDGPERVNFSYKLKGDPVEGGGSYIAAAKGANQTEVALTVRVAGSGPMAPMWEAMGRPLLPQFAKAFAGQLKAEIEKSVGVAAPVSAESSTSGSRTGFFGRLLRRIWQALFGRRSEA
jgi:carbon monoxide dehydrogenase subunit G